MSETILACSLLSTVQARLRPQPSLLGTDLLAVKSVLCGWPLVGDGSGTGRPLRWASQVEVSPQEDKFRLGGR